MKTSTSLEPARREAVGLLAAAADPVRLRILHELASAPRCVCDIQDSLPLAANLLSYHLRILREAGLVEYRRRGRWKDYSLAPGALERLHAALPSPRPGPTPVARKPAGVAAGTAPPSSGAPGGNLHRAPPGERPASSSHALPSRRHEIPRARHDPGRSSPHP